MSESREPDFEFNYRIPTGGELRMIRDQLDLTSRDVAHAIGFQQGTILRWENERSYPSTKKLRKLLAYYEVQSAIKNSDDGD